MGKLMQTLNVHRGHMASTGNGMGPVWVCDSMLNWLLILTKTASASNY